MKFGVVYQKNPHRGSAAVQIRTTVLICTPKKSIKGYCYSFCFDKVKNKIIIGSAKVSLLHQRRGFKEFGLVLDNCVFFSER